MSFTPKIIRKIGFSDICPVNCGEENCANDHFYGPAARDYYLLHFVVSGQGEFHSPRGHFYPGPGDIFVIRPGEVTRYQAHHTDPWHYIWIGFRAGIPLPAALRRDVISGVPALELFRSCIVQPDISMGAQGYEIWLTGTIFRLLSMLEQENRPESPAREQYVLPAVALMESEYATGLTVNTIAQRLHLERSYFTKIFRQAMGTTPGAYLHRLRLRQGAKLLTQGVSVTVAAVSTGYPDAFSFSRAFKSYYGCSPTQYANHHKSST